MANTLSVCLIVKNEADVIRRCLNSLIPFADEICVYDTGSTDDTVNICRSLDKVKVMEGEWRNDFAWARNQSFQMATCDYIMWCDADDVMSKECQNYILKTKEEGFKYDLYYMMYRYHVDEDNKDNLHFYRERIVRRILYPIWNGRIHETMHITAKQNPTGYYIPVEDCFINHLKVKDQGNRNLDIFRDMESKNEIYRGRDWFYFGNELMEHKFYDEAIQKYETCLATPGTWNIEMLNAATRCASLYKSTKNNLSKALELAYKAASFTNIPRADVCCLIGDIYRAKNNWEWAKFWYEKAINNMSFGLDATFYDESYSTWKPRLNLCLCEFQLGNKKKAKKYNDEVLKIVPDNPDAIHNKEVLEKDDSK